MNVNYKNRDQHITTMKSELKSFRNVRNSPETSMRFVVAASYDTKKTTLSPVSSPTVACNPVIDPILS
jgi:hypothetical protein